MDDIKKEIMDSLNEFEQSENGSPVIETGEEKYALKKESTSLRILSKISGGKIKTQASANVIMVMLMLLMWALIYLMLHPSAEQQINPEDVSIGEISTESI